MRAGRLAVSLAIGVAIAACGGTPATPEASVQAARGGDARSLSIDNGTAIPVTLVINGSVVETVAPGALEDPIHAVLPDQPWSIETRSPSGRVLSTLTVRAGDVVATTPDAHGHSSAQGDAVRVDLSCGRLDVWSGPPLLGPSFIPGPPGDCD
jgi:glucose/arabinose dehydrogenase